MLDPKDLNYKFVHNHIPIQVRLILILKVEVTIAVKNLLL